jgi:hypothetical protein
MHKQIAGSLLFCCCHNALLHAPSRHFTALNCALFVFATTNAHCAVRTQEEEGNKVTVPPVRVVSSWRPAFPVDFYVKSAWIRCVLVFAWFCSRAPYLSKHWQNSSNFLGQELFG